MQLEAWNSTLTNGYANLLKDQSRSEEDLDACEITLKDVTLQMDTCKSERDHQIVEVCLIMTIQIIITMLWCSCPTGDGYW